MRAQPDMPAALRFVAGQLEVYAKTADPYSRSRVLKPAIALIRTVAENFNGYAASCYGEACEIRPILSAASDAVPQALRQRIEATLQALDRCDLSTPVDQLVSVADRLDALLVDVEAWLESHIPGHPLLIRSEQFQILRALRDSRFERCGRGQSAPSETPPPSESPP